jgi:hypothetical protein
MFEKETNALDAPQIHNHFEHKTIVVRLKLAEIINFKVLDTLFPFLLKLRTETSDRTFNLLKHFTENKTIKKTLLPAPRSHSLQKLKEQQSERVKKMEEKKRQSKRKTE